jgi:hypothetical protein
MPYEPPSAYSPGRENRVNPTSWTESGAQYVPPNADEYAQQQAERAYRSPQQQEQAFYDQQMGGLKNLAANADARFAAARAAQESAVGTLGERAGTLQGSASLMAAQQAGENAQARAMVAGRTPYGAKGAGPESAILGGQIGQAQAAQLGGLEQEAAQRQAAYMRGVGALSQGLAGEASERRMTEAEIQRDMQLRFTVAQQLAAGQAEQQAEANKMTLGRVLGGVGAIGGAIVGGIYGGPAGAVAGGTAGGKIGSAVGGGK